MYYRDIVASWLNISYINNIKIINYERRMETINWV